MTVSRRALLLAALLAGCSDQAPRRTSFPPLQFDYLLKLQLNVASIEEAPPPPPGPLDQLDPAPPIDALFQISRDRLVAGGASNKAVFTVEQAELSRSSDGLQGVMAIRLDVVRADGSNAAFAEARVARQSTGGDDLRADLYDLTKAMLQDMNVEFEFQVRRSLRDWLQETGTAQPPAPVEQQPLTPPPGAAAAPPAAEWGDQAVAAHPLGHREQGVHPGDGLAYRGVVCLVRRHDQRRQPGLAIAVDHRLSDLVLAHQGALDACRRDVLAA